MSSTEYKRTYWENNRTPLSADNFNNMENGIEEALLWKKENETLMDDIKDDFKWQGI